jgi:translation elongation factor EF-G
VLGFDLATQSGPLCEEPMMGACFIIEGFLAAKKGDQDKSSKRK